MKTVIKTVRGLEVAITQKQIPLNKDGTVNYFGYFNEEKEEIKKHWTDKFN